MIDSLSFVSVFTPGDIATLFFHTPFGTFWLLLFVIFAVLALAAISTLHSGLVAFTVFLDALRLTTVATLAVLLDLYFWLEGFWISIEHTQHCILPFPFMRWIVKAANTVAPIAHLVVTETVTIHSQATRFLAVATHSSYSSSFLGNEYFDLW
jgi:hypothetical protein